MTDTRATGPEPPERPTTDASVADAGDHDTRAGRAAPGLPDVEAETPGGRVRWGRMILSAVFAVLLLAVMGHAVSRAVPALLLDRVGARGGEPSASPSPVGDKSGESCVDDSQSDMQGQGQLPPYADIVRACVHAVSGGTRLELTAAGEIPARMPDADTSMIIGYELGREGSGVHVLLQAGAKGWAAYLSDGRSHQTVSDRVTIEDRTIVVTLKSDEAPRVSQGEWKAETSWTRSSNSSADPQYAVDAAPDSAPAPTEPPASGPTPSAPSNSGATPSAMS